MNKLKILYGEHKQSLLDSCLMQISEYNDLWPDRRAFLIVPETAKADTERRFFKISGNRGLLMAEVLSFRRFAYRLFAEAGGLAVDHISAAGRTMLIQSLLRERRSSFKRFGRFADKPSHAAGIDSVLGDFRRYGIDADDLSQAAETAHDQLLKDKLTDFALLCRSFDDRLDKLDLCDHALDLDRLCELIQEEPLRLGFLRKSAIWIHGFGENRDFTAQEHKLISELVKHTESVSATICTDVIPGDKLLVRNGPAVFLHGRHTAWHLAENNAISIERVATARSVPFEALAGWLGHEIIPERNSLASAVKLIRAEDKRQELYYVAGEIRRLISEENYRYRDIAVAVCDLPAWQFMLQTVFREFGLDSFIDDQMPLNGTVLMRYVSSLIQLGRGGDRFENLISLLRTGLTDAEAQRIDHFENFCLALGLPNRGRYRDDRYYSDRFPGCAEALDFKHSIVDPLLDFARVLSAPASVDNRVRKLMRYLSQDSSVFAKIESLIVKWDTAGENHAAESLSQAWNTLLDLLDEMSMIFSDQKMSLESFANVLAAGMSGSFSRVIPTGLDRIRISDVSRMSQHFPRVLFVVGATRNSLPPGQGSEGVLLNRERQQLETISGKAFPDMERYHITGKANEIYTLLTSPADRLYLSCPSLQDSPSMYQQRLFSLLKEETLLKSTDRVDIRWNSPRRAVRLCRLAEGNQAGFVSGDADAAAIMTVINNSGTACGKTGEIRTREPLDPLITENISVSSNLVMEQYPDELITSVSRIQKFQECPYSHFAAYLLGLRERDTGIQDFRMSGSLLHSLIERAFAELVARIRGGGQSAEKVRTEYQEWQRSLNGRYVEELYRKEMTTGLSSIDHDQIDRMGAERILKRLVLSSIKAAAGQLDPQAYLPGFLEWEFPSEYSTGLKLKTGNKKLVLRGKIDRIDLHANGRQCRIIDYKSGSTEFDLTAVYYGMNLQLPIYLQAFIENNRNLEPGELGYFYFRKPIYTSNNSFAIPDDESIAAKVQQEKWSSVSDRPPENLRILARYAAIKAADVAESVFTGNISAKPSCLNKNAVPCAWCEFKALCNYDDRSAARRTVVLDKIELPEDYPNVDKMKQKELKEAQKEYIENLMKKYIDEHSQVVDHGE